MNGPCANMRVEERFRVRLEELRHDRRFAVPEVLISEVRDTLCKADRLIEAATDNDVTKGSRLHPEARLSGPRPLHRDAIRDIELAEALEFGPLFVLNGAIHYGASGEPQ